ncbi:MAG: hypothetical protein GY898_25915, partial [Proteobacteria bacterium]|nr:hypothetical protein [Pseudomonadota bacterium]
MSRRRIAIVSSCAPPKAGQPVTGGGLRTLQLLETVRATGHVPSLLVERPADPKGFAREELAARLAKLRPSAVILEQWGLGAALGDFDKPVVIDLHGSLLLENVYRRGDIDLALDAGAKLAALARADLLLVPSSAQLSWFASWATLAGLDPRELPLRLLPLALPGTPTKRKAKKPALRLVYGGARWPWIDSSVGLMTAAGVAAANPDTTLDVFLYEPPRHGLGFDEELGTWDEVEADLAGMADQGITLHRDTGHARFTKFLRTEATVALDVWAPNPERLLAATTRSVESLHAGLPVITVPEASWAPALTASGAGWAPEPDGLADLLASLAENGADIAKASRAATKLAAGRHSLEGAGGALSDWLASPAKAVRSTPLLDQLTAIERDHNARAVAALEADHRSLIDQQVDAHQVEIEGLKAKGAADIEALTATHGATVERITDAHRLENASILTDAQRRTREQLEHWQGELDRLRTSLEGELKAQAERHAQELAAALDRQHAERTDERGEAKADRESERDRHRAELQALAERHDQERAAHLAELEARDARHQAAITAAAKDHKQEMEAAAARRDAEAARLLEERKAEVAVRATEHKRQMEAAAANRDAETAKLLEERKAEVAVMATEHKRQMEAAAANRDAETAKLLEERKAEVAVMA